MSYGVKYQRAKNKLKHMLEWPESLLDVEAEALRAKIDRKSAFCKGVGELLPNFRVQRDVPTNHFCTDR